MNGRTDGNYGPADTFNIDHMATIICNAVGYELGSKDGYWAYNAVDYCVNTLKCLPSQGAITTGNYSVACSRELAVYMLVEGLGPVDTTKYKAMEATDIPDFGQIDVDYQSAILKAYQYGITNGTDSAGTFNPKDVLNRAQAAVIMYRAGYVKAVTKPTSTTTLTGIEVFNKVKEIPGVTWTEKVDGFGNDTITANEAVYGGLRVEYWKNNGIVYISMRENQDDNYGYGYEARQLMKKILFIAFPKSGDTAYEAMKGVFLQTSYEYKGSRYPSCLRWLDGRAFWAIFQNNMSIKIFEANNQEVYNMSAAEKGDGGGHMTYDYRWVGNNAEGAAKYEYDRW